MESGKITNDKITSPDNGHYPGKEAFKARLNGESAYCTPTSDLSEEGFYDGIYMVVDLVDQYEVTAFALQGYKTGYGYGKAMQFLSSMNGHYKLYKFNGTSRVCLT